MRLGQLGVGAKLLLHRVAPRDLLRHLGQLLLQVADLRRRLPPRELLLLQRAPAALRRLLLELERQLLETAYQLLLLARRAQRQLL